MVIAGRVYSALRYKALVAKSKLLFSALWDRRARIPLLLEIAQTDTSLTEICQRISQTRAKVSNKSLPLAEGMKHEDSITRALHELTGKMEQRAVTRDPVFQASHRALQTSLEEINTCVNDYNFALEEWERWREGAWQRFLIFGLGEGETRLGKIGY